jgi:hypothetical protein
MGKLQSVLAAVGGDIWASAKCVAIWPWPAVVFGKKKSHFHGEDYRTFTRHLRPGDMILTRSSWYFSNRAIKSTAFKHLAIYTGAVKGYLKDGFIQKPRFMEDFKLDKGVFKRTVTHAISEGVVCQDLFDFFQHVDVACVVRVSESPSDVVKAALDCVGLGYNFDFKPTGPKELYCTELGVHCLKQTGCSTPGMFKLNTSILGLFLPLKRFKSDVTVADAFIEAFDIIVTSVSANERSFWKDSYCSEVLRQKILAAPDAKLYI